MPRKYTVNDNFFKKLNPENAWIIGWILSDGCIQKNGRAWIIKIANKDLGVLEKIKKCIEYNGPIYSFETYLKKTKKKYPGNMLKISSVKMVEDLNRYGIVPNKSLREIYPPIIKTANEEIKRNFIRGVFEGDGTISWNTGKKQLKFQIVGTEDLLGNIQNDLIKFLNLNCTKLKKPKIGINHFMLRYIGNKQVPKIINWIYKNCQDLFLDRKRYFLEDVNE